MTEALVAFAVLALVTVAAAELKDMRPRRRVVDAGRSRLPEEPQRRSLRR
jgi:hypothetical protein